MKTKYFIGLDVHKESTSYAVKNAKGNVLKEGKTATIYDDLYAEIKDYLTSAQIGLESCTYYYTLYQAFLKNKYSVKAANTIQIRQLIAKNDKLDARRLAEMLRLGTFPESYIPNAEIQHLRSMVNLRHSFMEDMVRCNLRIQAFLDRNGVILPEQKAFGKSWKEALQQHMGAGTVSVEIRHAYEQYVFLEQRQNQLDQEMSGYALKHWKKEYGLIDSIVGFGPVLTCYVLANVMPIERFASEKKLRRYAGVVPTFLESGGKCSNGRIPKTTSRGKLRWAVTQASNSISKTNTNLGKYYKLKKKQKNSGMAKIAVASSLVNIIYKVLTTKKPYAAA